MVGRLELPLGSYPPLEVRVLELPLAARRASMFILLPDHPDRGLAPLEHNMTQNNMKALFSSLKVSSRRFFSRCTFVITQVFFKTSIVTGASS